MNAVSHGIGLILSIIAFIVLLVLAVKRGTALCIVSCAIYGSTLVSLYLASMLYHSASLPGRKRVLRILDHVAIYLLIAGTYTPFLLVNLRGGWGWSLFGVIWGCATLGIVLKLRFTERYEVLSTSTYIAMGWLVVIAIKPLITHVSFTGLAWLLSGGVLYTVGVMFFALRRISFGHVVWHLFVMAASTCHYMAVMYSVVLTSRVR
ncbi:MAG TPA: hemolysin III family protein [Terriglobales bacterium]|nr:hemolysin III family protein [Terriglobales bacterium]